MPLYVLDGERLRAAQPTHTVFNGVHNGMVENPLPAKPGERVRLFVLNAGPSRTSSFHVVGTIFDRVWIEGNPDNQFRGMQTVLLGSSIGLISATPKPKEADLEHHNLPATRTPSDPEALQGKLDFDSKCLACHTIGQGPKLGPDLAGATKHRSKAWLTNWLKSPEKMLETDADAKALLKQYNNVPMPNQNLSDKEIRQYLAYLRWADAQPAGRIKPSGAQH
jgi:nitrite reductase (NO-forming)